MKKSDSVLSMNQTDDAKVILLILFFCSDKIKFIQTLFKWPLFKIQIQDSIENQVKHNRIMIFIKHNVEKKSLFKIQNIELIKSDEDTEKIQVILDNASIRFPNKSIVKKLIDYINFESTNKFNLIINNPSRPNTSHSPLHRKGSIKIQDEITTFQMGVDKISARSF